MPVFYPLQLLTYKEDDDGATSTVEYDDYTIDLEKISWWKEGLDKDGDNITTRTLINMSGTSMMVEMSVDDFTELMAKMF